MSVMFLFFTHDEYLGGAVVVGGGGTTMFLLRPPTNFLVDKNSVKYGIIFGVWVHFVYPIT